MTKSQTSSHLSVSISFTVTEEEARALDVLPSYGIDKFIEMFYETLGKAYLQPHEEGLRSFLRHIREKVHPGLENVDKARKYLKELEEGKT